MTNDKDGAALLREAEKAAKAWRVRCSTDPGDSGAFAAVRRCNDRSVPKMNAGCSWDFSSCSSVRWRCCRNCWRWRRCVSHWRTIFAVTAMPAISMVMKKV